MVSVLSVNDMLSLGGLGLFYFLLLVFTIHAFFLGYHWFTFGTDGKTSILALAVYLMGGAVLFLTLSASLSFL